MREWKKTGNEEKGGVVGWGGVCLHIECKLIFTKKQGRRRKINKRKGQTQEGESVTGYV